MTADHPADLGVAEASAAMREGQLSSEELTASCLERIVERDSSFGAWLNVHEEIALRAAEDADYRRSAGIAGPLTGVPIGLKDVVGVAGLPLTADSRVLAGNLASEDAEAWTRLRSEGMVLLGHLHCGELACGTSGTNPWDPRFSPGGSSSGSAIAVATRTVPAALGTDSRGSIRIPACFNGVTALKPSFGLVSMAGCIPASHTFDVLGPIARSAIDCAMVLAGMSGVSSGDRGTWSAPRDMTFPVTPRLGAHPLATTRIGVPAFASGSLAAGVEAIFGRFLDDLVKLGATLVQYNRPINPLEEDNGHGARWKTLLGAEALSLQRQFAQRTHLHRDEFREVMDWLTVNVGSAVDYVQAQMKRAELVATWRAIFTENALDIVVEPGSGSEIWKVNEPLDSEIRHWFFGMWSDANFPVLVVPAGTSQTDQAPVGIQMISLPFRDAALLQVGIDYQAATGYHLMQPAGLSTAPLRHHQPPPTIGPQVPYVPEPSLLEAFLFAPE